MSATTTLPNWMPSAHEMHAGVLTATKGVLTVAKGVLTATKGVLTTARHQTHVAWPNLTAWPQREVGKEQQR